MKTQITAKLIAHLFGTALIAGTMLGGQAFAGGSINETRSTVVKFGDLNLDSPQGVATLYKRIHTAAKQVCGVVPEDRVFLQVATSEAKCMAESEARAIDDIHNVALEAYYSKKIGRPAPVLASNQK
jgi:UrcA family protein